MHAQIGHLLEIIQVLPFRGGGHAAGGGSVIMLRFTGGPDPRRGLPRIAHQRQLPVQPADLAYYWNMLNQLATEADPPIASTMILNQIRREL